MQEDSPAKTPNFAGDVSKPQARRLWRIVVLLLLLALACGAIWFIDRGAMLTNSTATQPAN